MQELADMELLRQYADQNSETAFATLVARHVPLVYSAALRKTGNSSTAEEVTQAVFIILAQKAHTLRRETILPGWLYQATRLTAANFLRTEMRRIRREQKAFMEYLHEKTTPEVWPQILPLIDDAMGWLGEKERNAVLLRFFQGKSFQEIGQAAGVSENAAQKRVACALEKLKKFFLQRGVDSTTDAIAETISANSIQATPATLVKSVTAVAIAKGATAGGSTLALIKGTLKLMAWAKAQTAIGVGAGVLLAAGAATTMAHYEKARHGTGIPSGWSVLSGNTNQWIWKNGAINGHSANGDTMLASARQYGDVTISAIVHSTNRDADFVFRMQDADNGYVLCFAPAGTPWAVDNGSHIQLRKRISGNESDIATSSRPGLPQSGKLTVVARGPHIEIRWNDITVLRVNDSTFTSGFIGVRVYGDPGKPSDGTFSELTFY